MSAAKGPFGRLNVDWLDDAVFTERISGNGVRLRYLLTTVACRDFSDGWITASEMRRWSLGNGDVEELLDSGYLHEATREERGFSVAGYVLDNFLEEQKSWAEREAEKEDQRARTARSRANASKRSGGKASAGSQASAGQTKSESSRSSVRRTGRTSGGAQKSASEPAPEVNSGARTVTRDVTRDVPVTSHVSNDTSTVQFSTDPVVAFSGDVALRDGEVVASVGGDDGDVVEVLQSVPRVTSAGGRQDGLNQISSETSPEASDGWSVPSRDNWPTSSSDPLLENSSPNRLPVDPHERFVQGPAGTPEEVQGSGNYDLPLTADQAQRLLDIRVNPRRFVRHMRTAASSKGWERIDWATVVRTQKPIKAIEVKDDDEFFALMEQLGTIRGSGDAVPEVATR